MGVQLISCLVTLGLGEMIQFDEYFRELKTPSRDVCFQETGRIED